jgi:hypothetical protein
MKGQINGGLMMGDNVTSGPTVADGPRVCLAPTGAGNVAPPVIRFLSSHHVSTPTFTNFEIERTTGNLLTLLNLKFLTPLRRKK